MSLNRYEVGSIVEAQVEFRDETNVLVDPTTVTAIVTDPFGAITPQIVNRLGVGIYNFSYQVPLEGEYSYTFTGIDSFNNLEQVHSGFFTGIIYDASPLDYLIPSLRVHLGDSETLNYAPDYLRQCLILAIKALSRRWRNRYIYSATGVLSRSTDFQAFTMSEPPTIETSDEYPVILQASIIIKTSEYRRLATTFGSWRDDEISYSNISSSQALLASLQSDITELNDLLPLGTIKLARTRKGELRGFGTDVWNIFEGDNPYAPGLPTIKTNY